jgi:general secretion pathway protein G
MALLVSIVAPRAIGGVARAEEAVLKQDLAIMRDALDKHYSDAGRYPASLQELVGKRYLRNVPVDPLTKSSATWLVVAPADPEKGRLRRAQRRAGRRQQRAALWPVVRHGHVPGRFPASGV